MAQQTVIELATGKRARSKAANRQAILEAARAVFARIGYGATTVRDIIRETELAAGTFYNYFKSKEEVFEALADDSVARFRPLLKAARNAEGSFEDFIREAYKAYFYFVRDDYVAFDHCDDETPKLMSARVESTPEMHAVFEEIRSDLELLVLRGEAPEVDTEYLTAAAIGIAREVGDHMLSRRPMDPEAATEFATLLLIGGLKALPTKT